MKMNQRLEEYGKYLLWESDTHDFDWFYLYFDKYQLYLCSFFNGNKMPVHGEVKIYINNYLGSWGVGPVNVF